MSLNTRFFPFHSLWLLGAHFVFLVQPLNLAFAQGLQGPGKSDVCRDQRLIPFLREHRFAELEIEVNKILQQSVANGDTAGRICARYYLGGAQARLEKYGEALANLRAALSDATENLPADDSQILDIRAALASALGASGNRAAEIKAYNELIPLYERKYAPHSENVTTLLRNLATAYTWVGNYPEAVRVDRQVLSIQLRLAQTPASDFWKRNRLPVVATSQINLAASLVRVPDGATEALLLAQKGLPEMKAMLGSEHPQVLDAQLILASAKAAKGDISGSFAIVKETLHTARLKLGNSHPVTRKAQNDFGTLLAVTGAISDAVDVDRKNLVALVAKQGASHPETILAYANLSGKLVNSKKFNEAIVVAEEGLRGATTLRSTLDFDSRVAIAWQGSMRRMVEDYLFALLATKRHTDAFLVAEFFKTRLLSDRLALDIGELRLSPVDRKRYRAALRTLSHIEQELAVRRSLKHNVAELEAKRLQAAEIVKATADARGFASAPETIPSSGTGSVWAQMVMILSDEKTAYVSFVRIKEQLYAVSFSPTGQIFFASVAPVKQFRSLIAATSHLMQPEKLRAQDAKKVWRSSDGNIRLSSLRRADETEINSPDILLDEMGQLILNPLEPILVGRQNIVFSTDDALIHLPFAALPYKGTPLVKSLGVSIIPSLEVLYRIRAKAGQKKDVTPLPLLAIGGARYQRIEQLAPSIYIQLEKPSLELMDIKLIRQTVAGDPKRLPAALASLAIGFPNLPGSEAEAKRVAQLFGGEQAGVRVFTGRHATEASWNALVTSGELERYRTIHLAAHGFLSDDDPALSAIVLGQVQREPGTDGYLTSAELSSVDLNSDLIVVSACNSGVSGFSEGEGMQGLAYALFEAGTRHSLLTLWPIDDKSTVDFMEKFYDSYRAGGTPSLALAVAQRWAIARGWPYRDWAGFVLHGN